VIDYNIDICRSQPQTVTTVADYSDINTFFAILKTALFIFAVFASLQIGLEQIEHFKYIFD